MSIDFDRIMMSVFKLTKKVNIINKNVSIILHLFDEVKETIDNGDDVMSGEDGDNNENEDENDEDEDDEDEDDEDEDDEDEDDEDEDD